MPGGVARGGMLNFRIDRRIIEGVCDERIKLRRSWFAVIENEYGRSKERGLTSEEKIPSKAKKFKEREYYSAC